MDFRLLRKIMGVRMDVMYNVAAIVKIIIQSTLIVEEK